MRRLKNMSISQLEAICERSEEFCGCNCQQCKVFWAIYNKENGLDEDEEDEY